jgi:hypothetical protein
MGGGIKRIPKGYSTRTVRLITLVSQPIIDTLSWADKGSIQVYILYLGAWSGRQASEEFGVMTMMTIMKIIMWDNALKWVY